MTCWSTVECWETTLGLATEGCCVVPDHMLIAILSMSVESLEMWHAEVVDALALRAGDLKLEDLRSPLCLVCVFKKLNLSLIQFCLSVISLGVWPDFDWVRFQEQVLSD